MIQQFGRLPLLVLSAGLWLVSHQGLGQSEVDTSSENFRERCRRVISGVFAESWNEANRARDAALLAERSLKALVPQQEHNNKQLAEIQNKLREEHYDAALLRRRDELIAQIKMFHEQIQNQEDLSAKAKVSSKTAESTYDALRKDVEKIFAIAFVDDPDGQPRKVFHRLNWKSNCPKYRTLCPLPPSEATLLRHLALKLKDEGSNCSRYAALK